MPIKTGNYGKFGRFTFRTEELPTEQSYSDVELRNSNWCQYGQDYRFITVTDEKYPYLAGRCFSGEWDGFYIKTFNGDYKCDAIGEQTDVIIVFSNSGQGYVYA